MERQEKPQRLARELGATVQQVELLSWPLLSLFEYGITRFKLLFNDQQFGLMCNEVYTKVLKWDRTVRGYYYHPWTLYGMINN